MKDSSTSNLHLSGIELLEDDINEAIPRKCGVTYIINQNIDATFQLAICL